MPEPVTVTTIMIVGWVSWYLAEKSFGAVFEKKVESLWQKLEECLKGEPVLSILPESYESPETQKQLADTLESKFAADPALREEFSQLFNAIETGFAQQSKERAEMEERIISEIRNINIGVSPEPAPSRLNQAPGFVGRSDDINALMELYSSGASCLLLHGQGGVGKTALAEEFAGKIKNDFDRYYEIALGGDEQPLPAERVLYEVLLKFNPELNVDTSFEEMQKVYADIAAKQNILLLLDNATKVEQIVALRNDRACLVVTSRDALTAPGSASRRVDQMSLEDARKLLFANCPEERWEGRANDIAALAGYLPMAMLPLAGVLAANPRMTADRLYAVYSDFQKLRKESDPNRPYLTIEASLDLSYAAVGALGLDEKWRALSVFPGDFEERAAAAVWGESLPDGVSAGVNSALDRLVVKNLLEFSPETKRMWLHDLTRSYLGSTLADEERFEFSRRHAEHFALLLREIQNPGSRDEYDRGLKVLDNDWHNIIFGQEWALGSDDSLTDDYSGFANEYKLLRLHPQQFLSWCDYGVKAAKRLGNLLSEGNHLGNLGVAYDSLGEYQKAIEYYEAALKISREIGDRRGEENSLGNLGNAYESLGEYQKAIEYHEAALKISRGIDDRLGEGNTLGNLGNAYYSLGEYQKAIEYHEAALKISREIGDRLGEGNRIGNLGIAYNSLGEYQKAIGYHEAALKISREIGDRRGEGNSLGNLGNTYYSLGEYQKAIEYHEAALKISREIGDRLGEGNRIGNLGIAYNSLGEYQKAIEYQEAALKISREIGDRRGEGSDLGNLGNAYDSLGEYQKAIEYQEAALKISREIGDRLGEGNCLGNLGIAYNSLGDKSKACDHWRQALAIFEKLGVPQAELVSGWIKEAGCDGGPVI